MDTPDSSLRSERFRDDTPVLMYFEGDPSTLEAKLRNVSETGFFVVSEITFPAGTDFDFVIREGAEASIDGTARVAWRRQVTAGMDRPPGMGCEILSLADGSQQDLERHLSKREDQRLPRYSPDRMTLSKELELEAIALEHRKQTQRPDWYQSTRSSETEQTSSRLIWILGGLLLLSVLVLSLQWAGVLQLSEWFSGLFGAPARPASPG